MYKWTFSAVSPPADHAQSHRRLRLSAPRTAAGSMTFGPLDAHRESPKVAPDFPANFDAKLRETKDQTRRNQPPQERLLEHIHGAPRSRTAIQKSKKKVSRDAQRSARHYPKAAATNNPRWTNVATKLSPQTPLATPREQTTCELCRQKRVSRQMS